MTTMQSEQPLETQRDRGQFQDLKISHCHHSLRRILFTYDFTPSNHYAYDNTHAINKSQSPFQFFLFMRGSLIFNGESCRWNTIIRSITFFCVFAHRTFFYCRAGNETCTLYSTVDAICYSTVHLSSSAVLLTKL